MHQIWNSIKATACDLWKRFLSAWKSDQVVSIVWAAFISLWLVAIAVGFLFNKWEEVRNFALLSTPLLGFPLLFHRTRLAGKQVDTDSRRLLADRYARSAELFASAELSARLAGLYALWDLAKEEVEIYHVRIMKILCAFIRNPPDLKEWELKDYRFLVHRPDMEAVLTLIRERNEKQCTHEHLVKYHLNFRGANLRRVDFQGVDLRKCDLRGSDLRRADFRGSQLQDGILVNADLRRAKFLACDMVDTDSDGQLVNWTKLRGAAINGAHLADVNYFPSVEKVGVVLTDDDGKDLPPGVPSLPEGIDSKELPRMTLREWEEKRGKKAKP